MSRRFIGIIAAASLVAILGACAASEKVGAPAPAPSSKAFTEDEWRIEVPDGWTRRVVTSAADAKKAIRYDGPNGEYVVVALDPIGSGYPEDAVWRYEVDQDRFQIVDKPAGSAGDDGRFDATLIWKAGEAPEKVGGHTWYFLFGNAEQPTIDQTVFEEILESIRVTA